VFGEKRAARQNSHIGKEPAGLRSHRVVYEH
jgi:hypothetical protein